MPTPILHQKLPQEADMADFAAAIARIAKVGDTFLLTGDIGAGKSAFSRAFIRTRLGRFEDVPSPTFTLVQTYDDAGGTIWHCDLYRLSHPDEAFELGLDDAFETAICLIEWPDRLGDAVPQTALNLTFVAGDAAHDVTVTGPDDWRERLGALDG